MFKEVKAVACFGERTGYQVHASRFFPELDKLVQAQTGGEGVVHISLLDTVTASQIETFPPKPSILLNAWEATEQPAEFIEKLKNYDQFWVVSEAQRSWSIAQVVPEEFVKVVPEGVDPDVYKPIAVFPESETFNFLHVGQFQHRKSSKEICQAFLKAFPKENQHVRLYLSVDTLFPSDPYKTTEERLEAYGLSDDRIIPIHFEERPEYVKRLQTAHVFVSCSRSEGFFLPGIEAMACGIPAIFADYGGSTEYSEDALLVRVPKLEEPKEIYGNWKVPGMWGSPDYDHLVELMKDAYENYSVHKEKALKTSEMIRTKFSWAAAAEKAYKILEDLAGETVMPVPVDKSVDTSEQDLRAYARKMGYEITAMHPRKAIFAVDCHPTTQEKMDTLTETLKQIHDLGFPTLVVSHFPLPANVIELCDFYLYDKKDILSGDDKPIYWRRKPDGTTETTQASIPCGALAQLHNMRNALDFCLGKYDWVYHMTYDTEIDLPEWLDKVTASDKDLILIKYEGNDGGVNGQIIAGKTEVFDKIILRIPTWEEFARIYGEHRFCGELQTYNHVKEFVGLENVEWIDIDVSNRFSSVDRNAWKDDMFACHFVDGPMLHISGISNREYEVFYSTPENSNIYNLKQKVGMWSKPNTKYYKDWTVTAVLDGEVKFSHTLDLTNQRVMICMGSKALGDTIAWMPYVEEFRKKHNCHVICSGWWMEIFDYPEIEFIKPGDSVENIYASYEIGCFDDQLDKNVTNWRLTPLQKVAADILGLEYAPIRAKLKVEKRKKGNGHPPKPYVCFSEYSTMRNKLWNREGAWQNVINHLNELGYDCVSVSAEQSHLTGVINHNSQSIQNTITDIAGADFYIGLNAGPTWVATALGIPTIMLTGVAEEWNDFPNPHRISVDTGCRPCFNNPNIPIDRGWSWCPDDQSYKCTREITEDMVFEHINQIREASHASKDQKEGESLSSEHPERTQGEGNLVEESQISGATSECR
jgi:autotransporter strand-loop-strand O-heptosyltransferase